MYSLQTYVFAAFLTTTAIALQPVTVEMEPINANGSITEVTLYRGRAAITRRTELDLKAGVNADDVDAGEQAILLQL